MLDEFVDELTESIKEVATGRSYATVISPASVDDLTAAATVWRFDWNREILTAEVYKLTVPKLGRLIHGLISIRADEGFVWINMVESHPENVGRRKKYEGIAPNLIAYACQQAFELGFNGYVSFEAKSELIEHYKQTLGAVQIGRTQRMQLQPAASLKLVNQYFGDQHGIH
ncbi:MAG: hypothetical protein ACKV2Q_32180 [Planctomycetaceae bacterium]